MLREGQLHNYQKRAVDFIWDHNGSALFLGLGLGKTISALTAAKELIENFDTLRVLVIAPLRVARTVWRAEAQNWEHTKDLSFALAVGTPTERKAAIAKDVDITLINRENIPWLVDEVKSKWKWDMIIIDESSSFKNPMSKRFRALKKAQKYIKRVTLLTATPASNSYMDLWSQIFLLDGGYRLGRNITAYRNTYFDADYMGWSFALKNGAVKKIQDKIGDLVLSMDAKDYLDVPDYVSSVVSAELPKKLKKEYAEFENEMLLEMEDGDMLTAVSAAVLTNKLLQFSSGAIYDENKNVHHIHDLKFDLLDEIMEFNDNVIVFYNYKHELERLKKRYPKAVEMDKKGDAVIRWNNKEIKMLLAHPASSGHGLNLQKGGSVMVWFGFTWSLENYKQAIGRLHRQGQEEVVNVIHLAVGDVEYSLMRKLALKDIKQNELLEALK